VPSSDALEARVRWNGIDIISWISAKQVFGSWEGKTCLPSYRLNALLISRK